MTTADGAANAAPLQQQIEQRDQLLAAVYARADTLERTVELLERQLEAAIEAQREATTERAELRRLLGNSQLQIHALLRLPAGTPDDDRTNEAGGRAPRGAEAAPAPPPAPEALDQPAAPRPPAAPASRPAVPRARRDSARQQPRSLADEARGLWSSLRRMV